METWSMFTDACHSPSRAATALIYMMRTAIASWIFFCGLAVTSLGHGHPRVVRAIKEQAEKLTHVSNVFHTEPTARLLERLANRFGSGKVFLGNSGAEANEAAIKLARRWGQQRRRRTFRNSRDARLLPRPHPRHIERHRSGKVSPGLSAADAGLQAGAVRRSRSVRQGPPRPDRRHPDRTDPGRRRSRRLAQ